MLVCTNVKVVKALKGGWRVLAQATPGPWKAQPEEEPEFANDPPELDAAFMSITDQDPWAKAEALLEQGLTVQQVTCPATHSYQSCTLTLQEVW
jgi:hypothetical protein